jgi:uncharacterized Fe-S cluster protein YjdI
MSDRLQTYTAADGFTVTFDPTRCTHSGKCVRGLPAVFDGKRRPWVLVSGADTTTIEEQVRRCPSGALQARR